MPQVCDGKNDCGHWLDEPRDQCGHNECQQINGGCDQVSTVSLMSSLILSALLIALLSVLINAL